MKQSEIQVGKAYTNDGPRTKPRKVLALNVENTFAGNTRTDCVRYSFEGGYRGVQHGTCTLPAFAAWAKREWQPTPAKKVTTKKGAK